MLRIYITTPEWDWGNAFILGFGLVAIVVAAWALLEAINWILDKYNSNRYF